MENVLDNNDDNHFVATSTTLYAFPTLDQLAKATDSELRTICGLGYRSKFILETIQRLQELGGEDYLYHIKSQSSIMNSQQVQDLLCTFAGVGRKVADCVALFSFHQDQAIPVDTHVWNIARRDYDMDGRWNHLGKPFSWNDNATKTKTTTITTTTTTTTTTTNSTNIITPTATKTLTPHVYRQVGDLFRTRFGYKPGWAHSLLFVAELPSFRPILPHDILHDMDQFRQQEQEIKKQKKDNNPKTKTAITQTSKTTETMTLPNGRRPSPKARNKVVSKKKKKNYIK